MPSTAGEVITDRSSQLSAPLERGRSLAEEHLMKQLGHIAQGCKVEEMLMKDLSATIVEER